jgi:hypothetical protein
MKRLVFWWLNLLANNGLLQRSPVVAIPAYPRTVRCRYDFGSETARRGIVAVNEFIGVKCARY